jgi:antitoxin HicB
MMNKTIDDYLRLPHTIEIYPDEEDGGFVASVRELPGCFTHADTWAELQPMIEEAKRAWLEVALEFGDPIPEPQRIAAS